MVKEKKLLCRKCAKVYPNKVKVAQYSIDTGLPNFINTNRTHCPVCNSRLTPLEKKK